eukprot:6177266-Pleurochrysis_carterae.AAC.1
MCPSSTAWGVCGQNRPTERRQGVGSVDRDWERRVGVRSTTVLGGDQRKRRSTSSRNSIPSLPSSPFLSPPPPPLPWSTGGARARARGGGKATRSWNHQARKTRLSRR